MSSICQFDHAALSAAFVSLEKDLRDGIILKALSQGGKELQRLTQDSLRSRLGAGATSTIRRKKPMVKGVTSKADKAYQEVRVTLMGDFRLKWFELGTKERRLLRTGAKDHARGRIHSGDHRYLYRKKGKETFYKRGESRGRIKPLRFFEAARAQEAPVMEAIEKSFYNQVDKIFR